MSVFLNNLDDYIAPSQACVNPLVLKKTAGSGAKVSGRGSSSQKVTLETDFSKTDFDVAPKAIGSLPLQKKPDLIRASVNHQNKKVATVSLNDCLACSGCVTSAETVLIQEQSYEKLLNKLELARYAKVQDGDYPEMLVVCISPQSIASIAGFLDYTAEQRGDKNSNSARTACMDAFLRIATILKKEGVDYVLDMSAAGDVALVEAREEFLYRHSRGRSAVWTKPPTTVAASSSSLYLMEETWGISDSGSGSGSEGAPDRQLVNTGPVTLPPHPHSRSESDSHSYNHAHHGAPEVLVSSREDCSYRLPMLASQCPGFICYAEKTQPQALPYIGTAKSPQQVLGTVIKTMLQQPRSSSSSSSSSSSTAAPIERLSSTSADPPSSAPASTGVKRSVFLVSVQPCFDKKLEASRLVRYRNLRYLVEPYKR
jgi:iron only hydrogenase large subunit-like protein